MCCLPTKTSVVMMYVMENYGYIAVISTHGMPHVQSQYAVSNVYNTASEKDMWRFFLSGYIMLVKSTTAE